MVGHTHEDIDAAFSKISDNLRRNDAETMVQLMSMLPSSQRTQGLYNIREWLEPNITPITGQTGPLHYKFSRDERNNVVGEYKGLKHRPWKKMPKPMLKQLPKGLPKVIIPSFKKYKFELLRKNIERCKFLFSDIVFDTQYRWWQRFVNYIEDVTKKTANANFYARKNAKWLLPLLPRQSENPEQLLINQPAEIQEMIDKEVDDPMVSFYFYFFLNSNDRVVAVSGFCSINIIYLYNKLYGHPEHIEDTAFIDMCRQIHVFSSLFQNIRVRGLGILVL